MKKIISEKLARILKNKKRLEKKLNVKINNRGKEIYIEGEPLNEYSADLVITALDFGFKFSSAILIKEQNFVLDIMNIKDHTKRSNLGIIRSRIIGKDGKTMNTLRNLTNCDFELKDNEVGIIGPAENIEHAQNAVISIIKGAKQGNVYSFLEKHQIKPEEDLGLREGFK